MQTLLIRKISLPVTSMLRTFTSRMIRNESIRRGARELWGEVQIARAARAGRRQLVALADKTDLRIHLGCGADIRPGWVNLDLVVPSGIASPDANADTHVISYDLRQGMPLTENSCAAIYSSHFFEHLEYRYGLRLLHDCFHALKTGGILRLCMPNYRVCFEAYLRHDREFFRLIDYGLAEPESRLLGDYMTYSLYQFGEHKCFYDEERFLALLTRIGFRAVEVSEFQAELDIGAELRRKYSYYIQAFK